MLLLWCQLKSSQDVQCNKSIFQKCKVEQLQKGFFLIRFRAFFSGQDLLMFSRRRWLCPDMPWIIEQTSQSDNLSDPDSENDEEVEAGPEGHSPKVVF